MFKLFVLLGIVAVAFAAPAPKPGLLAAAPLVSAVHAPLVTASSSQYVARNHNAIVASPLAYATAPLAYTAPAIVPSAYAAHYVF